MSEESEEFSGKVFTALELTNSALGAIPLVDSYDIAFAKPANPTLPCPKCGVDHTIDTRIMMISFHSDIGKLNILCDDSADLFKNIINGQLSEEARACLAKLETGDLQ